MHEFKDPARLTRIAVVAVSIWMAINLLRLMQRLAGVQATAVPAHIFA